MWFKCSKWPARAKWNIIGYSQMSSSQIFLLCLLVLSLLLILIRARLELPHLRIINSLFCLVPLVLKFHKQLELSHCRKLNKIRKLWILSLLWNSQILMIKFLRNCVWNCQVIIITKIKTVKFWFNKRDSTIIGLNKIVYQLNLKGIYTIRILFKIKKKIWKFLFKMIKYSKMILVLYILKTLSLARDNSFMTQLLLSSLSLNQVYLVRIFIWTTTNLIQLIIISGKTNNQPCSQKWIKAKSYLDYNTKNKVHQP